ncbi:MAG: PKD domain-containing protein [Planctomycetota bacterium]|nr:PKD domain-containing protein [Planctomycetota bacterium]
MRDMCALGRLWMCLTLLSGALCAASESGEAESAALQPSFPNHALAVLPPDAQAAPRAGPAGPVDTELPFSWTQVVVTRAGATNIRVIDAFDPGFEGVLVNVLPYTPQNVRVDYYDGQTRAQEVTVLAGTAGLTETFSFQVTAGNLTNPDVYSLIYDIRTLNSRIRGTPYLTMSPGDFVKPGQIVRYTWTQTGRNERRPKAEAEFVGRTGTAKGLTSSTITEVLAVKVQPFVLGHYLLTVTPRDVRGEPPRGSTSNGRVFRCAFGSDNLPPATDGFVADTFTPDVGQVITLRPMAIDPETGRALFDNQTYDFGDGTVVSGISGATTHAYTQPGIYRVRCTATDDQGLAATAEDNVIAGATSVPQMPFSFVKQITPEEAGIGELEADSFSMTFKNAGAKAGDRIVFCFNRNYFGRLHAADGDDTDIVLKAGGGFTGATALARNVSVQASGGNVSISVSGAHLDRTGDPRFGRADLKGIFKNQRLAVCVVPADGSTPHVLLYTGNVDVRVKGGQANRLSFVPEQSVTGKSTLKEPNPKRQEIP